VRADLHGLRLPNRSVVAALEMSLYIQIARH
jgi:hypothetical protein